MEKVDKDQEALEDAVLGFLHSNEHIVDSHQFAASIDTDHTDLENVIKRLKGYQLVDAQDIKNEKWVLTPEGKSYAELGSPEVQLFLAIPPQGIPKNELKRRLGDKLYDVASRQAGKNRWVEGKDVVVRKNRPMKFASLGVAREWDFTFLYKCHGFEQVEHVEDRVKDLLNGIENGEVVDSKDITELKKRKLIELKAWKGYSLTKGPNYVLKRTKAATDLTREHLQRGDWMDLEFKEYNLGARGPPIECGYLHPLLKVREQFQSIFLQMGFEEMPTNNFVESSFWNFDALFQPQQHPARDSHDTFFLKVPSTTRHLPEDYVEKVKRVHESGGYGSKGYGYEWKIEEAQKNVLRTHTTAVSARMLYKLAKKPFSPKKYFSIDRVFRNEAVDRTHLAEFYQIEGLICDRGLSLGDLMGVLKEFFERLGMSQLRFKPAYNPYTEPSMEIFSYHSGLKKWVEVGNSGMFRPEMLLPMGFPEDVSVIAWGLSLERPTMILYGIDNIRDLFGHKVDFNLIKSNPICRLGMNALV